MARKIKDQEIAAMRAMRAQEMSDLAISFEFNCAASTVWKYTRDIPRKPRGPQGPKRFAEMAADRLAGMSTRDIAVKYGYASASSADKVLHRFAQAAKVEARA